jgi:two-component system chemotaxis response regulator CheB
VIGCSTGGPQALEVVLKSLSRDFPVPILVVQHMPAVFTTYLASRLNQECPMEVREAADGELLEAGKVLIAPGDYHLEIARQGASMVTVLQQQPPENSCRPSVDVLFRSAAKHYGSGCLAVVLTGMGHDGLRGAQQIFQAQGTILAQDQATSVVWGMPRAVAEARIVSAILPVREFGRELQRRAAMGRRFSIASS